MPINPLQLVAFVVLLGLLLAFVQVGLLTVAFEKLGLSSHSAFLLLFVSLFGSALNLPTVKIGADLLRLNVIRKMGVPVAAIGGAGTFDGIFITGIVAVLLA